MENFQSRNRDMQDGIERHVFGKIQHLDTGAIIKVRGNGTVDEEAVLINLGVGANFAENKNTEVFLLASGSDPSLKLALVTIPRDKQRAWKEGTGGVQHPEDPAKALEFNAKRAWITDNFAALMGILEVKDGKVIIRGDLEVSGTATVNVRVVTPDSSNGTVDIPPFEE
jgi:hypothetical protein